MRGVYPQFLDLKTEGKRKKDIKRFLFVSINQNTIQINTTLTTCTTSLQQSTSSSTMEVNIPTTILQETPSVGSIVSNLTQPVANADGGRPDTRRAHQEQGTAVTLDEEGLLQAIAKLTLMDKEGGDGGDSDEEGEEIECHGEDMFERNDTDCTSVEQAVVPEKEGKVKGLLKITATGTTEFIGEIGLDGSHNIDSINGNINLPKPPSDFVVPPPRADEPLFENVDNPGNWDRF